MNRLTKAFSKAVAVGLIALLTFSSTAYAAQTVTYFHNDLLGSPVAATNQNGDVIWRENYQAFGEKVKNDDTDQGNNIGYTGHVNDADTGLTYMQARYYDPILGRFYANDPVGFQENNPAMFNRYAYANNNPYVNVDPDGKKAIVIGDQQVANNFLKLINRFDPSANLTEIQSNRYLLSNNGKGETPGNMLISKIVADDNIAYLMNVPGKMGVAGSIPMTESDPQVQIDFSTIDSVELRLIKNGKSYYANSDPAAVIAHELIHALNGMEGIVDRTIVSYLFMAVNGKKALAQTKIEELRAVGIGHQRADGISENAIRDQMGLDLREGYQVSETKKY
ncbi:RHS repeat-associated core domain-containing protein [Reinekea sp. G2M2-21]|uniref:RHS repeat-associated core domain-containing protein n=1 Tax=Reinekea sp. G2M2-21 TaxID=2788942 RepID=UPI0018A9A166|nr:RHS repeat-associated core domain-containing protein [Reinekea sp. G2M2-21]